MTTTTPAATSTPFPVISKTEVVITTLINRLNDQFNGTDVRPEQWLLLKKQDEFILGAYEQVFIRCYNSAVIGNLTITDNKACLEQMRYSHVVYCNAVDPAAYNEVKCGATNALTSYYSAVYQALATSGNQ